MNTFENTDKFVNRHIGPNENEVKEMLRAVNADSLDELINQTVPQKIRNKEELDLGEVYSEHKLIFFLRDIADKNKVFKSFIGMGYYGTILPPVIQRNVLENPGWYTQYTPYQAEISQGRLEALINYQTMIIDLTGLAVTNASLLDEGTAAAEAMHMLHAATKKKNANKFFISENCFPQTIDILKTRSEPLGVELVIGDYKTVELTDDMFGVLVQYPDQYGEINDYKEFFEKAHAKNIYTIAAADILSLAILTPPGEFGADVAVGSAQRFGVPVGYGGPHAGYMACKDDFRRMLPGRIIGQSIDSYGNKAYRMALQTREQHIRREKATSNICTAQVLLAIIAGMYAIYHGPKGLKQIAERVLGLTKYLEAGLIQAGYKQLNKNYFDTIKIDAGGKIELLKQKLLDARINVRYIDNKYIGISFDQAAESEDADKIISIFAEVSGKKVSAVVTKNGDTFKVAEPFARKSKYLQHPVFNTYQSETDMLRYITKLENKDLSLTMSMIPLGSCTMKLNATTEMMPITWPKYSLIHPFAPIDQAKGYFEIFKGLEESLAKITGLAAVSLQPNSGAQGEYTGLMVIRAYHKSRGEGHRNIVLIPQSAHGTNPASAVMAGMKVVVTKCNDKGDIDYADMKLNAEKYKDNLAALMVTYPSTHGVFEDCIMDICKVIHDNGGQVYMDGANLNAQVGLTNPGFIGADVCHINLHKTFCIPHGGGGPGMGPIAVAEHLAQFLPGHPVVKVGGEKAITAVSAAPWGSADILLISYAYIRMMGGEGLKYASEIAILNANYVKEKLKDHYTALYTGEHGRNAHELIFDTREFKRTAHIEVDDIAKRLIDYGFHAPTVSFPVPGTLMFEPTESEPKKELDRFIEAMIAIREEIREIEEGKADMTDNVLKNAPHTAEHAMADTWTHPYSREKAVFPIPTVKEHKFWVSVGRVDNAYGDRNFMCTCEPISSYMEEMEAKSK
ncbi:MAG: glycine dehydrogenase (aminomethyl-transferring) [Ignavibacteriae bacterium]|nr:MAG: glycine dehydrogenase (aminomethyl-transferring) [Ignavibacteriota bacterium]